MGVRLNFPLFSTLYVQPYPVMTDLSLFLVIQILENLTTFFLDPQKNMQKHLQKKISAAM